MRVLLQSPAPDHPGGDTSHLIEKTREYLAAVGVAADHTCELEPDLAGYDLVHLFGAPKMDDLLTQCANAQRQCKPLVFSAQYWDEGRLPECLGAEQPLPTAVRLAHSFGDHLYRVVLGEADVVLTASQMEGGWLTRDMGVAPEQQRVVPLAAESFFAAADAEPFVERVGVRDFVLCSAVLARPKNQLRLIRALRGFNTPLVLAYPSAEDGYERRCREEAGDDVIFVGRLDPDELASAYAAAKVHALVSCYEPTGMSSIEAGLAGCNLVCTAHSPISEYVGNRAWYADPLDVAAIRRAVELAHRVPKSHVLRNELLANFTWERTARLTLAAYEGLLAVGHAAAHRKGEARYRWLTACRRSVGELRDRVMAVTAAADAASAASAPARAQARIDTLARSLRERDEQLQAITDTWAYRLHHYLATSAPARALRRLRNPGPPPVFRVPRGPALDALGHRAEDIQRVLVVAEASAWHVLRALRDLRRALPDARVLLAGVQRRLAHVEQELPDVSRLELTRTGYGELTGLHDAVIVAGKVDSAAAELAERTGARILVQYNTSGYFTGSAVMGTPAEWRDRIRRAAIRRPIILGSAWLLSRVYAGYVGLWRAVRPGPRPRTTCIGCGAVAAAPLLWVTPGTAAYVRCPRCGLVQTAAPRSAAKLADPYENREACQSYLDTRTDPVTRSRHERILAHIERWVSPGRVLDVECADGRFLEVARDAGWQIEGLETSAVLAREAARLSGTVARIGTLEDAALAAESFDAVNISDAIERVRDPKALLVEARRVLKPGGVAAVSTPNVNGLASLVQGGHRQQAALEQSVALFSARTLAGILKATGFDVLEMRTYAAERISGPLWTTDLLRCWPAGLRRDLERHEPQLNEYLAEVGMGEELLAIARKRS